ncbi:MAG: hypothetical protein OEW83_20015 [Acidimicrobiia bacterium]|nr:hypothetical protein [Acidimicrobiia bacterium]
MTWPLRIARWSWLVAAFALAAHTVRRIDDVWRSATLVGGDPQYYIGPDCYSLSVGQNRALEEIGLSAEWHGAFVTFRFVLVVVTALAISGLLWRRAHRWAALFLAWFLIATPFLTAFIDIEDGGDLPLWLGLPTLVLSLGGIASVVGLLFVFPDDDKAGRSLAVICVLMAMVLLGSLNEQVVDLLWEFGLVITVAILTTGLGIQIRRIRRSGDKTARDLLVIACIGIASSAGLGLFSDDLDRVFGSDRDGLLSLVRRLVFESVLMGVPIVFGLAVLWVLVRRGEWDMDVQLKGSLGYAALSTTVVLGYFVTVAAVQAVVNDVAGQSANTFAVMVSTAMIAGLFLPARRRLQDLADRLFDRRRRDAARLVADFEQRVAKQGDPANAADGLLITVDEVFRPTHATLWLAGGDDQ